MEVLPGLIANLKEQREILDKIIQYAESLKSGIKNLIKDPASIKPHRCVRKQQEGPCIHEEAYRIIKVHGSVSNANLLALLECNGITVGGKKPTVTLNSILARKPDRFVKINKTKWAVVEKDNG